MRFLEYLAKFLAFIFTCTLFAYTTFAFSASVVSTLETQSKTESSAGPLTKIETELPGNSLYLIDSNWQNQNADVMQLKDLAGKKQIVSLIYTHCQHTCPIIVENMRNVDKAIAKEKKDEFAFVLVTLTPESDTPAVLKTFAQERGLDTKRWTLLRGDPKDVHLLAMALETEYKAMADGEVSHSNLISILDEQGEILYQAKGAANQVTGLIEKVKTL